MSSNATGIDTLTATLTSGPTKKQLQAVYELSKLNATGNRILIDFLKTELIEQKEAPTAIHGSAYQRLGTSSSETTKAFINQHFPNGLLTPQSEQGIDYSELQKLLVKQDYQSADKLTMQKLCELAGEKAVQRKWVYFTEVSQFPITDLRTIDTLWRIYSEDRFGWSKQHELWERLGKDWERLWTQLIWKSAEGAWTRYPTEFIWDLSAPVGHLPLSNQLRGVRMMDSLLSHPAWTR
ncbi:GUN4-like family [Synechococcus sp. PCC 7335]|uniref:GUN4 domain-containing protein n=1 Tax=Synechococcus sp. (strain ATCC 29403 / PCC 7335) TaxID=91464 RepID=UPI00017EB82A|nr:GUN4 domain-containing protein [Synechococcus sp. PCC 7335]EDX85361.1 GUN4-like family [Synechococcus sp. PCC 7335]